MLKFTGHRIAAIFAHPDDEAYSCSGLLAMAASQGAIVTVVSATRGEAGRDREGFVPPGPALARMRTVELGMSCNALGIQPPIFLNLPDGDLEGNPDLPYRLRDVFRRLRPNVVITLGEDGAYGHRDHLAVTDAVMRQVMSMKEGDTSLVRRKDIRPRLLFVQFPRGLFTKIRNFLKKSMPHAVGNKTGTENLFGDPEPGIDEAAADVILDVRPWRGQKLNALAAHRSQLKVGDPKSFLVSGLVDNLLDREMYTECAVV